MASARMSPLAEMLKQKDLPEKLNVGAFTIQQVAELLQVSPRVVYMMISEGQIRSIKVGKRVRIPVEAYHEFLTGRTGDAA
jgi:excisionase family DNA binding protein